MFFPPGFNFGFPGQGGEGDDDDDHEEDSHEEEDQDSLYEVIGVDSKAGLDAIILNFELLKAKHGPQGQQPDAQKLAEIQEAFEVLSDPEKRKVYDIQRKQQKQHQGNLLQMMMGGGMGGGGKKNKQLPKMQSTKRGLEVTLEDLYEGKTIEFPHERSRLCEVCKGKGGQNVQKCRDCGGQGGKVRLVQVGPGMFTQAQEKCAKCDGKGDIFGEEGECKSCEGKKIAVNKAVIPVKVQPGSPPGEIIKLEGEGNQVPDALPGDLLLVIQEKAHEVFTRKGADLFLKKHINLVQALIGFHFTISHLNGKEYRAYTAPGEVIGDGEKKVLIGLGMPLFRDEQGHFGNLIIDFKVDMPKRGDLTPDQLKALAKALPGKQATRPQDHNYQMLEDFDKEQMNPNQEGGRKDQGDEYLGEEEGVECGAQ